MLQPKLVLSAAKVVSIAIDKRIDMNMAPFESALGRKARAFLARSEVVPGAAETVQGSS